MANEARLTVPALRARKGTTKISAVTAYDYTLALLCDEAGVDVILVGDSLGMVVQGEATTLPVTMDQMTYHCRCVSRGARRALVVGDLPFLSYQTSESHAIENAGRLLKDGGVSAVKLEGGVHVAGIVEKLVAFDIPVMGHVGLTPQSFHRMGGHRIQGRRSEQGAGSREQIIADAKALDSAGAFAIVVEGVPADLAAEITESVSVPTIGIGAGPSTDGQILVSYDMLGLVRGFKPRFAKRYAELGDSVVNVLRTYANEVRAGQFPSAEHTTEEVVPQVVAANGASILRR